MNNQSKTSEIGSVLSFPTIKGGNYADPLTQASRKEESGGAKGMFMQNFKSAKNFMGGFLSNMKNKLKLNKEGEQEQGKLEEFSTPGLLPSGTNSGIVPITSLADCVQRLDTLYYKYQAMFSETDAKEFNAISRFLETQK